MDTRDKLTVLFDNFDCVELDIIRLQLDNNWTIDEAVNYLWTGANDDMETYDDWRTDHEINDL